MLVIVNANVINHVMLESIQTIQIVSTVVDKLVEECIENIEEVKMAKITLAKHGNEYENKRKYSCTLYIVLFSIILTIRIGIGTYFIYQKIINPSKKVVNNKDGSGIQTLIYWTYKVTADVKNINIKNRTYYFFNDMINTNNFDSSLLKNR